MENDIRVGDYVKLHDSLSNNFGHNFKDSFEVVGLEGDVLVLKDYLSNCSTSKIHKSFFVLDDKEIRKRKLEKLFK